MPETILDSYVTAAPSPQNALDIFQGEWASRLPAVLGLNAGEVPLFEDGRVMWAFQESGGVADQSVVELGPLEAGHSYMLQEIGKAGSVTAVEANTRAYLKCLIVKETLNLSKCHFLCGDFIGFLEGNTQQFDFALAAGVLYHMTRPARLLSLLSRCTRRVYVWTHYYSDFISQRDYLRDRFVSSESAVEDGFRHTLYRQEYREALQTKSYCGGSNQYSNWMNRSDILDCLRHFGFDDIRISHEIPEHPHGPCFSVLAMKK
jgi:hypothetical protein